MHATEGIPSVELKMLSENRKVCKISKKHYKKLNVTLNTFHDNFVSQFCDIRRKRWRQLSLDVLKTHMKKIFLGLQLCFPTLWNLRITLQCSLKVLVLWSVFPLFNARKYSLKHDTRCVTIREEAFIATISPLQANDAKFYVTLPFSFPLCLFTTNRLRFSRLSDIPPTLYRRFTAFRFLIESYHRSDRIKRELPECRDFCSYNPVFSPNLSLGGVGVVNF